MRKAQRFGLALLVAIQPGLIGSPAYSNEVANILGNLTGITTDVDAREAQIEKRLQDAVISGRLTKAESDNFMRELQEIEKNEAAYRASDNKLTTWESFRLSMDLDRLSRDIESHLRDRTSGATSLDAMKLDINRRLNDGLATKRLTRQEFEDLQYELNRISTVEASLKLNDGTLDYDENMRLAIDLDRLSAKLERTLHDREVAVAEWDARQAELSRKITDGIASGKLTSGEAQTLKAEFERIEKREAVLKASGRPITTEEKLTLLLDLEKLNNEIDLRLTNQDTASGDTSMDADRLRVEKQISQALASGKVTILEAQDLNRSLQLISSKQKDMMTDGQLSAQERQNLAFEYALVEGRVNRLLASRERVWSGISAREIELEKRISESVASGRLTEAEARTLRAELARIKSAEMSGKEADGTIKYPLVLTLAVDLERLGNRINQSLHDRTEIALDLDDRRADLEKLIIDGINNGSLTLQEAQNLSAEADRIARQYTELRTSGGSLDYRERLQIAYDLERLASQIDQQIRDHEKSAVSMAERKLQIDHAILSGISSGRLTDEEVQSLRSERDRLLALEAQYQRTGHKLSLDEMITLATGWDRLHRDVRAQRLDHDRELNDVDARQMQIGRRIAEGKATGALTEHEVMRLKRELDRIAALEAQFKGDGGLSYGEQLALLVDLEKLSRQVERQLRDKQIALPDIDRRQSEIDREIAQALWSGRMALKDSTELRAELDRIAAMESTYRASGGGLSAVEAQMLMSELDKVDKAVDARLRDGRTVWKGVEGERNDIRLALASAEAARRIKPQQLANLRSELDRIAEAEAAFKASGGGVDLAETVSLVHDLSHLRKKIDLRLGTGSDVAWDDISTRKSVIERRINMAVVAGLVSPGMAKQLRREFQQINQTEALFRANDGKLNQYERMAIASQLDKLDRKVPAVD
ncbi:MAG TPA: hypothetical protein V6D17_02025 [Candidatus Obscuribacterales bacterium]